MSENICPTEAKSPISASIDERPTLEILQLIHAEDQIVPRAVGRVLPEIAIAVEYITKRLRMGGHMIYVGAGTSGLLGALDAFECPPTFGTDPSLVQAVIAGSNHVVEQTVEYGEDDVDAVGPVVEKLAIGALDAVIGITASGTTPYVIAVLEAARRRGAATILVTNNAENPHRELFDVIIAPLTGPEILAGSTRMKAGTAQKMILNMLSTCVMIRLGKVYDGYMVNMQPSTHKLRRRALHIVESIAGCSAKTAQKALLQTHWHIGEAVLIARFSLNPREASALMRNNGGRLRGAIREMEGRTQCTM